MNIIKSIQSKLANNPDSKRISILSDHEIVQSESILGFPVPALLKEIYSTIGNGGFGPGYGLLGLHNGFSDDLGNNAIELYKLNLLPDSDDPSWIWPTNLLPICHWGCAIYSCIDCSSETGEIVTFDPNLHDESWKTCFILQPRNIESWIRAWIEDVDLWKEMYGTDE